MSWLDKLLPEIVTRRNKTGRVPKGLWRRCSSCRTSLYKQVLEENLQVCPNCNFHMRIGARKRIEIFLDGENRQELALDLEPVDQLNFKDIRSYRDRLGDARKRTGEKDALVTVRGNLAGMPVVVNAFEFNFQGGSMGYAVGEKFALAAQCALDEKIPLINFSASGGARMQEALISLVQMAKTCTMIEQMKRAAVPYISVLTDPVYGGVSASLASLGDINISEPQVRAGFAGPNIIRETMRIAQLPEGFQSAEFLLKHGAIDMIVSRSRLRNVIASFLSKLTRQQEPRL